MEHFLIQFKIGICPVTMLCGGLTLIDFGFAAFFNIVLTVFIETPVEEKGYGFTPTQNAECETLLPPKSFTPTHLTAPQFSFASGSASSPPSFTATSPMTASRSGSAAAKAVSGNPSTASTRSGSRDSSSYPSPLASSASHLDTISTTWSWRSPASWAASRPTASSR